MTVGLFRTAEATYGGSRYEEMAAQALAGGQPVVKVDATAWVGHARRPQSFLRVAFAERANCVDVWIRNEVSAMAMTSNPYGAVNIAIAHHFDDSMGSVGFWNRALEKRWLKCAKLCDRVVVVAQYWRQYLADRGLTNIEVIQNAFDVSRFNVSPEEVEEFRSRQGFSGRPIVYVGNCQERKGAPAVVKSLGDQGYELVSSGLSNVDVPIRKFMLPYQDYIRLLAASDVVIAMSSFKEGWNRTAHEALLCKTPVVGSGMGGMRELLEGAGQMICDDPKDLAIAVKRALAQREQLGTRGYDFAKHFTSERFSREWQNLTDSVLRERMSKSLSRVGITAK